jgi:hypothetical protein
MDAGKIFVIVVTVFVIGLLAFLELKSRRVKKDE